MKRISISVYLLLLVIAGIISFIRLQASNFNTFNTHNQSGGSDENSVHRMKLDSIILGDFTLVGPYTTQNLQVFLIKGEDQSGGKQYLTLADAMKQDVVKVKETGSVNQLSIDNKSDHYIFIHSGDIVKGGKQDRTIAMDVIIPPNTKDVPLESFCVESGRWTKRKGEVVDEFSGNSKMLSSKELKMAAKYERNQRKVWDNVAKQQNELKSSLSDINGYVTEVASEISETSLQLTLESKELEKISTQLEEDLKKLLADHPDAVGYAYAINGELFGVDIYNNRQLFKDLWPKISESIVTEAFSQEQKQSADTLHIQDVQNFMSLQGSRIKGDSRKINSSTQMDVAEDQTGLVEFNTIDKDSKNWIHKNYMKKVTTKDR